MFPKYEHLRIFLLTFVFTGDTIHSNWIAWIEARFSRVCFSKVVQPPKQKGCTAEVMKDSTVFRCWFVREYLPDCHKVLCGALSLHPTTKKEPIRLPMPEWRKNQHCRTAYAVPWIISSKNVAMASGKLDPFSSCQTKVWMDCGFSYPVGNR